MNRSFALVLAVGGGFALAGCGGAAMQTADSTSTPPSTIAGVAAMTSGAPPKPSTPTACARRWNGAANAGGRAAAKRRVPKAHSARIQTAGRSGYFREQAGRCLIYVITPPKSAAVFVEAARGRYVFTADATGHFAANAELMQAARLHLR